MEIDIHVHPAIRGKRDTRSADRLIARLAATQHGVVSREQLLRLGLGAGAIDHRLECGRLHRLHRGVFAVGHRVVSRRGAWTAAILAAGPGAVLSHRSAAALWGIRATGAADVDVTVPSNRRRRAGIAIHRTVLLADEVTDEPGIVVTTPARTLLDLAGVLTPQQLESAINEVEYRRLGSPVSLGALVARHPGRRGTTALKEILDRGALGGTVTRSALEDRFLALLDAHRLPRPRTNHRIDGLEVDAAWPGKRLIVELDGHAAHATRRAFERDRARDRHLTSRGYRVLRITWRQLHEEQATIAAQLGSLLSPSTSPAASPSRP